MKKRLLRPCQELTITELRSAPRHNHAVAVARFASSAGASV